MKNWQFGTIVLCILSVFCLLFIYNQNTQKQNIFEKEIMCRNLYSSYNEYLKDHYYISYNWLERWVSNVETFYNKELDTCIVSYQIRFIDKNDSSADDNNYLIESIPTRENYWLIMACHDNSETDCLSKRNTKISELK